MTNLNYGQPGGQPPYGPPSGQGQFYVPGQQPPAPYAPPHPGQPGYGHPAYQPGYPGYSSAPPQGAARSNPGAGLLVLLGALLGLAGSLIPPAGGMQPNLISAFDLLGTTGPYAPSDFVVLGVGFLAVALGALVALIAAFPLFARRKHAAEAVTALFATILLIGGAIMILIVGESAAFESGDVPMWLSLGSGVPALIGTIVAFARK